MSTFFSNPYTMTMVLLFVAGNILFDRSRDVQFKKLYHPWILAATHLGILIILLQPRFDIDHALFMVPIVGMIGLMNHNATYICEGCARRIYLHRRFPYTRISACPRCGRPVPD